MDTDTSDITTNGFGNCLTRDGQGSATANQPLNGFHHTGASPGVANTDYLTVGQIKGAGGSTIIPSGAYLGEIRATALSEFPSAFIALLMPGWHPCSGQTRPRTDPLWVIASSAWAFGNGDGSTTYTLPDLRGRAPFGKDDMGGSGAGRLSVGGSGVNGALLGGAGGDQLAQAHGHTTTDPTHVHGVTDPTHNHSINDPGHTHTESTAANSASQGTFGVNAFFTQVGTAQTGSATTGITTGSVATGIGIAGAATGLTVNSAESGNSQNVPPALVLNYVIFVGA
jgi:microcystin-dependent protein